MKNCLNKIQEIDLNLSRLLVLSCPGALEIEGFNAEEIHQKNPTSSDQKLRQIYESLRLITQCPVFTTRLGIGSGCVDEWEVYRFEVRCPQRFEQFFVYPNGEPIVVQLVTKDDETNTTFTFKDTKELMLSTSQWFSTKYLF